jgi:signal transduction histidine kinase
MPRRGSAALPGTLRSLALAQLLALAVSMEYLFQPYVWRHWPVGEVLLGWLSILLDRAWVALAIAVLGWLALHATRNLHLAARATAYCLAVVLASLLAEKSLHTMGSPGAAVEAADLALRVLRWSTLAAAVAGLLAMWRHSLETDEALLRARHQSLAASSQLAGVHVQALQAQIEPHFLFNTLATARRLGDTDPDRNQRLLAHLHDFVRLAGSAAPTAAHWRLRDELELVKAYLGVFELRMNGRLQARYEVAPETLALAVPPLALATLVENAVKHGITPATDGGEIVVGAAIEPDLATGQSRLVLQVTDTGVGFDHEGPGHGSGMGLANTRRRLHQLYGDAGKLELGANSPRGARAAIRIPAEAP